jgi:hypothetical protein
MQEKLTEVVAKAAADPDLYPDLELLYERGHDLSGTIRCEVRGGHYALTANATTGRTPGAWSGDLSPGQRRTLWTAMADTHAIATPSSTRNIGDDEEPVFVTVRQGGMSHKVTLWHDDAVAHAGFHGFERRLLQLLKELSGGAIIAVVD